MTQRAGWSCSYDRKGRLTGHRDGDGVEVRCRYGIQEGMVEITTASSLEQGRAAQALAYNARGMAVGMGFALHLRTAGLYL